MGKGSGAGGARGGGGGGASTTVSKEDRINNRINEILSTMTGNRRADYIRSELSNLPLGARLEYTTAARTTSYDKIGESLWRVSGTPKTMMSARLAGSFSGTVHGQRTKIKVRI